MRPILRITPRIVEISGGVYPLTHIAGVEVIIRTRRFRVRPARSAQLLSGLLVLFGFIGLCAGAEPAQVLWTIGVAVLAVNLVGYGLRIARNALTKTYLLKVTIGGRESVVYVSRDREEVHEV